MAEEITLQYGGRRLALAKSDRLIAVKPRPGMDAAAQKAISSLPTSRGPGGRQVLGGFQLIEVSGTPQETNRDLDVLRASASVHTGSHVFHTSNDGVPFVPTGSVYIKFKHGVSSEQKEQLLDQSRLEMVEARDGDSIIARTTAGSPNPVKVAAALQTSDFVAIAEPELATPGSLKAFNIPADAALPEQWHLKNVGHHRGTDIGFKIGADARVVAAWELARSLGSSDVLLAVVDDGFDLAHPDLAATNKVTRPWDFTRNNNSPLPDATTQDWHGTCCAGVAVGSAGGGEILGAAPGASFMPVRWGPELSDTQLERWFKYVAKNGAWVVSCSWGAMARNFPLSARAQEAISDCSRTGRSGKGCVIVFAAGNENRDINDPVGGSIDGFAVHPDVIAVAACTSRDEKSDYSNFGSEISVCAPSSGAGGWGILTADVTGSYVDHGVVLPRGYDPTDYTYDFGGTSSACPLVAGVCALVLSANGNLTAAQVKNIICSTARRIGSSEAYKDGHSPQFGYGCVDAQRAVDAALAMGQKPIGIAAAA